MSDVRECQCEPAEETVETEPDADIEATDTDRDDAHLDDIEVGAGCTEIWEHLADQRDE